MAKRGIKEQTMIYKILRTTPIPQKRGRTRVLERIRLSYSTGGTRRVTFVTIPMISHE
jgi:hypothetical protein